MKIKADYSNAPAWKELAVKSSLPEELKCLDELAHNMWWAWNYEARELWRSLDEDLYEEISLQTCVNKRTSEGGTGLASVEKQITLAREKIKLFED